MHIRYQIFLKFVWTQSICTLYSIRLLLVYIFPSAYLNLSLVCLEFVNLVWFGQQPLGNLWAEKKVQMEMEALGGGLIKWSWKNSFGYWMFLFSFFFSDFWFLKCPTLCCAFMWHATPQSSCGNYFRFVWHTSMGRKSGTKCRVGNEQCE